MITRALLLALALLGLLCLWQRGSLSDARRAQEAAEHARDDAKAELSAAKTALDQAHLIIDAERANAKAANDLAATYEEDKTNAQATANRLAADLRAERERLHPRWQATACPAADAVPGTADPARLADGGAADRADSAGRIVGVAAAADAQIKGLQAFARLCSGAGE